MVEVQLESSAEQVTSLTVSSERIGRLSNTDVLGRHSIIFSFCTLEILKYLAVIFGVFLYISSFYSSYELFFK
jgi:site-specific recombinase